MDFLRRTWAEIDVDALIHNFNIIKEEANGTSLMAVVKSNAYGHSVNAVAPILEQNGVSSFAVSNIEEALELRNIGITKPILILGYTPVNMVTELSLNNITQCVFSVEYANSLSNSALLNNVTVKIHVKLDTGMGRIGFDCRNSDINGIYDAVKAAKLPGFEFDGIFTHFAVSDRTEEEEDGFTQEQYNRFKSGVDYFIKSGLNPRVCHCCNSAAFCIDPEKHLDMCRPGIILYGLTPSSNLKLKENFIPVMTLKSVVSMVKEIKKDETVSYGRTFKASKNMKIATVAIGYADGYPRFLSNKGYVIVNGKKANIIGRVCMDQLSIDVSNIENVKQDDEVILFGKELPVEVIADMCETINYEIICGIAPRVPRIIVNKD